MRALGSDFKNRLLRLDDQTASCMAFRGAAPVVQPFKSYAVLLDRFSENETEESFVGRVVWHLCVATNLGQVFNPAKVFGSKPAHTNVVVETSVGCNHL